MEKRVELTVVFWVDDYEDVDPAVEEISKAVGKVGNVDVRVNDVAGGPWPRHSTDGARNWWGQ